MIRSRNHYIRKGNTRLRIPGYDYSNPGHYFITINCHLRQSHLGRIENGRMILSAFGFIALYEWLNLPSRFRNVSLDVCQIMPDHMHGIIRLKHQLDDSPQSLMISNADSHFVENISGEISLLDFTFPRTLTLLRDLKSYNNGTPAEGDIPIEGASPSTTPGNRNSSIMGVPLGFTPIDQYHHYPSTLGVPMGLAPIEQKSISDIIGSYKSLVNNICLELHKLNYRHQSTTPFLGKIWHSRFYDRIIRKDKSLDPIRRYILNNPNKWNKLDK